MHDDQEWFDNRDLLPRGIILGVRPKPTNTQSNTLSDALEDLLERRFLRRL